MMPTVVTACTLLHNICEIHIAKFDEQWLLHVSKAQAQHKENVTEGQAENIWTALAEYFLSNPLNWTPI